MDINLKDIFKRFSTPLSSENHAPGRDWRLIVIVALSLNAAVILGSLYLFWQTNASSLDAGDTSHAPTKAFDSAGFARVKAGFDQKEIDFAALEAAKPTSTDPSL